MITFFDQKIVAELNQMKYHCQEMMRINLVLLKSFATRTRKQVDRLFIQLK